MKFSCKLVVFLAACVFGATTICAQAKPGGNLPALLAQLDSASQHFSNTQADFRWDYYELVVRDTTTQTGSIYFERKGGTTQMGAVVVDPSTKAKQKVIAYKGGVLQMFDPGVDQITVLHEGNNQAEIESFLTLGFGGSGSQLAQAWNITDLGPDAVAEDPGVRAVKLDLVSKDPKVRNMVTHATIWIDPSRAVSLKQVFYLPSGDIRTSVYTNIKVNAKLDMGAFAIKKNSHTTVVNR